MARLIDTINRVLQERREIILKDRKKMKAGTTSALAIQNMRYSTMNFKSKKRNGSMEALRSNEDLILANP